jgi:hypothetical protein
MDMAVVHRYGPWVLLAMGLWGVVYVFLLYGAFQRLILRVLASAWMEKVVKDSKPAGLARTLFERTVRVRRCGG